jgi:hypothetical protein
MATEAGWIEAACAVSRRSVTPSGGAVFVRASSDDAAAAPGKAPRDVLVTCAHDRLTGSALMPTRFLGGAHVDDVRYKVKPCRDWVDGSGTCPRGVRCDFAHGPIELRVRPALAAGAAGGDVGGAAAQEALKALTTVARTPARRR